MTPTPKKSKFHFSAGQYITLRKEINTEDVRRAYSICSTPESGEVRVAIKAVEKGLFSTYATSQLKVGDLIEVHEPEGKFMLEPTKSNNYLGIAAGSGITPIISIIKTTLLTEPDSSFTLVYGNKSRSSIIFFDEI